MEMTYSRHDHERWLRGPGRADLEVARQGLGQGAFTDEGFEEEVETQMELFDRSVLAMLCLWLSLSCPLQWNLEMFQRLGIRKLALIRVLGGMRLVAGGSPRASSSSFLLLDLN